MNSARGAGLKKRKHTHTHKHRNYNFYPNAFLMVRLISGVVDRDMKMKSNVKGQHGKFKT